MKRGGWEDLQVSSTRSGPELTDRYGAPSAARRRVALVASGVVGAALLSWVVWAAWIQVTPQVQSALQSFDVLNAHTVSADVSLKAHSPQVRASCLVQASGTDHSVVGELTFQVTGISGNPVRRVTFRTERAATSVELVGCTAPGQKRPR